MNDKELILIETVIKSCALNGFHGTSVDVISKESGISKATIYKYFKTKEELISRSLQAYSEKSLDVLVELYNNDKLSLDEKIDARFSFLEAHFDSCSFNGCFFQLAYSEYFNQDEKISSTCIYYKKERQRLLGELLRDNGVDAYEDKAIMAELIYNGLLASLQINKKKKLITMAKSIYKEIVY